MTEQERRARIFKAFCDENRLTILGLLKDGEICACNLQEALSIGQSTLSHHMRILYDAGVINARKEGKWTYYSLNRDGGESVVEMLKECLYL